jgi:hypothetical protein
MSSHATKHLLVPRSYLRLPRRTARLRLSLIYGGLFLICGAGLLAISYGLERANVPNTVSVPGAPTATALSHAHGKPRPLGHPHNLLAGTAPTAAALVMIATSKQKRVDLNAELVWSGVALPIMTLLSLGLGWYIAGRVLQPVRAIARTA